ncbi:MAG: hypothetical protein J3T61_00210 [Candidatus Brocadiales bacterium]|nr:hypothetical protein [Candidatus Bathyanammoxibius sp.]
MPIHASVTVTAVSTTESTVSNPIILSQFDSPFNVSFGAVVSGTGTITYTVQHTFEDVSAGATWFDNSDVSAATASRDGNLAFPAIAIRVLAASGSGQGIVTLTVLQAGL